MYSQNTQQTAHHQHYYSQSLHQSQESLKQIEQHILQQYRRIYTIEPSANFVDIQFVPFENIPKFLKKSGEPQIFRKFFAITQCPLYEMFTIIIFQHLYDLEVCEKQRTINEGVIKCLKSLIYSQDFLKGNYQVKRLAVEGFRYMDQINLQKKSISGKRNSAGKITSKMMKDSGWIVDQQKCGQNEQKSSYCSSSEFSNSSGQYAYRPITKILIERDLIKGFVECWRQIVDKICIQYQLQLLRQQDELQIMELLSSYFELQFAFALYKGKSGQSQNNKQNSSSIEDVIPCFDKTTHISIVFNQQQSFQKPNQNHNQSIEMSETSHYQKLNWKTFVFFNNANNPPPSQKTAKFLSTLNSNKQKLITGNCKTIKQDQKQDLISLPALKSQSFNRSYENSSPQNSNSIIQMKLMCFGSNQYPNQNQDQDDDLKLILNKNLQKTTARKKHEYPMIQPLQEILRNSKIVMQKGEQLIKQFEDYYRLFIA